MNNDKFIEMGDFKIIEPMTTEQKVSVISSLTGLIQSVVKDEFGKDTGLLNYQESRDVLSIIAALTSSVLEGTNLSYTQSKDSIFNQKKEL